MGEIKVELIKKWSDWDTGDILTLEQEKAKRVIAKGYAVEYKPRKRKAPVAETATKAPRGENATVTPDIDLANPPEPEKSKEKRGGK